MHTAFHLIYLFDAVLRAEELDTGKCREALPEDSSCAFSRGSRVSAVQLWQEFICISS